MSDKIVPDSFGPAQERRTRTPIEFKELSPGNEGDYTTASPIQSILANIRQDPAAAQGTIRVDPNQTNDVGRTIRHEAIHQVLLNQLGPQKAREVAQSSPLYNQIASQLHQDSRFGNTADEVPAYMGAYEKSDQGFNPSLPFQKTSETSVPPDWRTQYINDIKQKLSTYPDIQRMFSQLSQ